MSWFTRASVLKVDLITGSY